MSTIHTGIPTELTDLTGEEAEHLHRLIAGWGMLSDLCFGDLVLLVPQLELVPQQEGYVGDAGTSAPRTAGTDAPRTAGTGGFTVADGGTPDRFVIVGQVRPSTNRTLHRSDLLGKVVVAGNRDLVFRSWSLGQIVDGEFDVEPGGERARTQCIPVRCAGKVIAILSRESPLGVGRKWGELERVYVELFERFARMILEGSFPFPGDEPYTDYAPRVGDGLVVLDKGGRVAYASPNAVNALHRMGVLGNAHGMRIDELVPEAATTLDAFLVSRPVIEEVEKPNGVALVFHCIPLIEYGIPSGAALLVRDVSDLRHRDRMLLSKEAAIREIHHRVKNNLQTISSLLRLQARRLGAREGQGALREAERRIRSIAVVHEILAQEAGDQVPFDDAVAILVAMAKDALPGQPDVNIEVRGDAGSVPADVATPLALATAELLQNALEHAFDHDGTSGDNWVVIDLGNDGHTVRVEVSDNGRGLPPGLSVEGTRSLGLSIVRDLVRTQLKGSITLTSPPRGGGAGTSAVLDVPVEGAR